MMGERRRILIGSPFPPRLDGRHGGSRAIAQLVAALAARHTVALLALRDQSEPGVDDVLRRACEVVEEVGIPPVGRSFGARAGNKLRLLAGLARGVPTWAAERTSPEFAGTLRRLVADWAPDIIQFEYRIMGQFLPVPGAGSPPGVLVDPDPDGPDTRSSGLAGWAEGRAWASLGRRVMEHADALVVFTDRDRMAFSPVDGRVPVVRIPLAYDLTARPVDATAVKPHRIVWVGSFVHPPNVEAVFRLARDIFPAVKARVPDASLDLVGSHATPEILALADEAVAVQGDVPDVRPHLEAAAVLAVPVRLGGGMRVKVLEGLSAGMAIVATPLALEGLDLRDREHVWVAETDQEFEEALVELLTDPVARTALGTAARHWAERHLDMDAQVRAYEGLYTALLAARVHSGPEKDG